MKLRRLFFLVLPLSLVLAGCLDPTGPRIPDDDEDNPDQEPDQNALVVVLPAQPAP